MKFARSPPGPTLEHCHQRLHLEIVRDIHPGGGSGWLGHVLRVAEPRVASPNRSFAGSDATRLHPHVVGRLEVVDERAVVGMAQKTPNRAFLGTRTHLSQRGRAHRASPHSRDQTNGKLREQTGLSRAGKQRSAATSTRTPWRSDATVASLWWKSRSKRTPTFREHH